MRLLFRDRSGHLRNGWKALVFAALFAGFGATARAIAGRVFHLEIVPLTPAAVWLSAGCALAATAICARAAAHAGNPGEMGPLVWSSWADRVLASLLYGMLLLRTGSLALPVGIPSLLGFDVTGNATGGVWVPLTRGPDWLTGGAIGPEASLACHAMLAAASVLVARAPRSWKWPPWRPTS